MALLLPVVAEAYTSPLTYSQCVSATGPASTFRTTANACTGYVNQQTTYATDPFPGGATNVFYFCDCGTGSDANCQVGSDANNGTSPNTPFQTFTKFTTQFNAAAAAKTVFAMCRGGAFAKGANGALVNTNATSSLSFKIRDYGPGQGMPWTPAADRQPILNTTSGNFGLAFRATSPIANGFVTVENIDISGPSGAPAGGGVQVRNGAHDITLGNVVMEQLQFGIEVDGNSSYPNNCYSPGPPYVNNCLTASNIFVNGATIVEITDMGVLATADNLTYNSAFVQHAGSNNNVDHAFYFNSELTTGTNPIIIPMHNESLLNSILVDVGPPSGAGCDGTQIEMHGVHENPTIAGNVIVQTGARPQTGNCYGISVDGASGGTDYLLNPSVHDNVIVNPTSIGINMGCAQGGGTSNNIVVMNTSVSSSLVGISMGGGSSTVGGGSNNQTHVNNTVYMSTTDSLNRCFANPQAAGGGFVLANNACYLNNVSATFESNMQILNGSSVLQGGTAPLGGALSLSAYQAITNGSFAITINGTACTITGINLSGAAGMGSGTNVAGLLQTAVRACGGQAANVNVDWIGTFYASTFSISTPRQSTPTTMTVASSAGVGTDLSGPLGLDNAHGAAVVNLYATMNNNLASGTGPSFRWELGTGDSVSAWASAFTSLGWDSASLNSAPQFVNASGLNFTPAGGSPLIAAGIHALAPATDVNGVSRPSVPSIGAVDVGATGTTAWFVWTIVFVVGAIGAYFTAALLLERRRQKQMQATAEVGELSAERTILRAALREVNELPGRSLTYRELVEIDRKKS